MANIFDYIEQNGQLSFEEKPFGVLDALTLAGVAYLPFCDANEECRIDSDVLKDMIFQFLNNEKLLDRCILRKEDPKFAREVIKTSRFGDLKAFEYVDIVSIDKEEQFSAITFLLPNGNLFIAFSGTDASLVGWKENFNMSFTLETAGQNSAKKYVEKLAYRFPSSKISLGGHSKGGNLAVYAGAFVPRNVQNRIERIYNFDGPGFLEETVKKEGYLRIRPKVKTYIPRSSIVGMLLEQTDEYTVIHSKGIGTYEQHKFYNWKIEHDDFLKADQPSQSSLSTHYALRGLLASKSKEERERFVEILGRLVKATKMKTIREVLEHSATCSMEIFNEYINLSKEDKKIVHDTFVALGLEFFKGPK